VVGLKAGWPLIYCGSKVCSGQVRAHLYTKFTMARDDGSAEARTHPSPSDPKSLGSRKTL